MGLDSTTGHSKPELQAQDNRASFLQDVREQQETARMVAMVAEVEDVLQTGLSAVADQLVEKSSEGVSPKKDIWGTIYGVFDKFPSGASITSDQFQAQFGDKSAALLNTIGVQSIEITNAKNGQQHYKLTFSGEQSNTLKTAEITHGQTVEFDVKKTDSSITLDHVKGLKVKKTGGRFSATIDRVDITNEPTGNIVIVGKGHWGIFGGSKRIVIAPDGSVTSDK